ncbi:tRNA (adenosine(37)-N6)-threonylcarbamoyltransferase complex dimerization subunit type 1 TsaB [Gammaproteobacteria bacterium]|nr:tRNA (adenosine(37)-N6)-threonylcarbamoyltransferase complex dimerization subunit type 1 TsaB [Gammaproteobacteria bacterium]MDB3877836.1 tRNA (adenosine(37)-N6)-threonylcarbamoyltransferase complex dimerization subunit type 1 TsaB [Gammaproteobacteria bacterium]MDC0090992.1 tRNA (adenosine(37)-N6)-threonylcarbamoyltransferase complex dimerization subunit type 1 TsaB [Gammaproteobacteria bacterium]
MKILAFDISGTYSSIALLNGNEVNAFTQTHERKHRPEWDELFSRINFDSFKDFDTLDALAFAQGPGSYTALRITASFLKPIAVIKNKPLIPVSSLKSLAYEASQWIDADNASILVAIEADKSESYFGSFSKSSINIETTAEESVLSVEELSLYETNSSFYFAGTGWPKNIQNNPQYLPSVKPGAEAIAAIAKTELETGKSFDPELANPVYLKTPEYQKK